MHRKEGTFHILPLSKLVIMLPCHCVYNCIGSAILTAFLTFFVFFSSIMEFSTLGITSLLQVYSSTLLSVLICIHLLYLVLYNVCMFQNSYACVNTQCCAVSVSSKSGIRM